MEKEEYLKKAEKERIAFEMTALKIRKGKPLTNMQAQEWVRYNFLNFKNKEKDEVIDLFKRRNNMRLFILIMFPVIWVPSYGYFKRYRAGGTQRAFLASIVTTLIP